MPALNRAFAFAQVNHSPVLIGKNLNFDVARLVQVFFQVNFRNAKGAPGFALRHAERGGEFG